MRIQNQYIQVSPSAVQSFSPSILTLLPFSQIPAFLSPVSVIITPFPFYFPKAHSPSYLLPLFHEKTPCPCFLSSKQYPLQLFPSKKIKINHKSQPDLHLNDQFVLQQVFTTTGMNYYLTGTEVWYTGNGLNKKATIVSVNNSVKGQVIIQLKAEIAWRSVTIKVTSTLSTTQTGGRRLLTEQITYDPVSGQTDTIECIKAEGSEKCPTCDEEKAANGYSSDECVDVDNSSSNGYILAAGLFAMFIMV
ncbi:unnamed protein product [Paramecium octaurelia]|uniref:Uncharacterized protein n=1 Tax=Paramecium octaurelia TaxID=43137 RepID=A0A8S1YAK2_PAROT|nr:unnamed protein product [Paramecium octaurelia]